MSTLPVVPTLYRIDECADLMTDACISDEHGELVFLSVWARDTAIQQFLARLTLGTSEDGLQQFHLVTEQGSAVPVFVGNIDRLEKRLTRAYRRTLFGSLTNLWLYDTRCAKPDQTNASALAVLPLNATDDTQRLWALVQQTCPLPLLDHWRDTVLALLRDTRMLTRLSFAVGPLQGYRPAMDVGKLTTALGALIQDNTLNVEPFERMPQETLQRVA